MAKARSNFHIGSGLHSPRTYTNPRSHPHHKTTDPSYHAMPPHGRLLLLAVLRLMRA
jgi:hypothetical protein